ncbi:MAG: FAD-dependent oxidoreductase [Desulfobacterales bacterium]|nr:FAD-dependent oxidoreductase [Desulfobacterales bacterium]
MKDTTHEEHNDYPPCKSACPILTDVREYVQLIAERRFEEAFAAIRKKNPLPRVCGRICTHPCEAACKRGQVEEPVAIAALKRFASDGAGKDRYKAALPDKSSGHKVAVVGSGPAGFAAAHDLALLGHQVTIFEALPLLGGMLRVGVPEYRLPKAVLADEIQAIVDLGIEVKTGVRIGEQIKLSDLFEQGYKAVFMAIGAHKDRKLGIAGEDDLDGAVSAVSFLRQVNQGENPKVGKKVAVIGGGNTAVDSARSALRLGAAEVHIIYRRTSDEMPAAKEEIEDAIHEGVRISYLTSPVEIIGKDGNVSALKCIANELGEPDASGRRTPKAVPGSEFTLDVDMVIAAIGQAPDSSFLSDELKLAQAGERIDVEDLYSLATSHSAVFAGGDAVTGPATAVKAIAAGKRAAVSIDCHLTGKALTKAEPQEEGEAEKLPARIAEKTQKLPRCHVETLPTDSRLAGFDEVASVLTEDQAIREAQRCLHCNLGAHVDQERCIGCGACVRACPLEIPSTGADGKVDIDIFQCQACGTCVAECPVQAADSSFYPHGHIVSGVEIMLRELQIADPFIVGLFSQYGNFTRGHLAALGRDFPQVLPVMVFGLERVSLSDVLRIFQLGADGILMAKAPPERCHFPEAQPLFEKRTVAAKDILDLVGLGAERLISYTMPHEGLFEGAWLDETIERFKALGPNRLRRLAVAA